jgi:hypothetical protein
VLDLVESSLLQAELWQAWLVQEMDRSPAVLKYALQAQLSLTHLETLRDFLVAHRDCLDWLPAPVEVSLTELRTVLSHAQQQLHELKASCSNPSDRAYKTIQRLATLLPVGNDDATWQRLLCRNRETYSLHQCKTNWR